MQRSNKVTNDVEEENTPLWARICIFAFSVMFLLFLLSFFLIAGGPL